YVPMTSDDSIVQTVPFIYWEENGDWIGYLRDYPDYWTQGATLDDLKEHLKDLYLDLTGGEIPGVRKLGELSVSPRD
ncbi:MAG: type II toxin-antitoxin system HicB family antitoxin, partial [Candidatus Saccharimonadales bacterium]